MMEDKVIGHRTLPYYDTSKLYSLLRRLCVGGGLFNIPKSTSEFLRPIEVLLRVPLTLNFDDSYIDVLEKFRSTIMEHIGAMMAFMPKLPLKNPVELAQLAEDERDEKTLRQFSVDLYNFLSEFHEQHLNLVRYIVKNDIH